MKYFNLLITILLLTLAIAYGINVTNNTINRINSQAEIIESAFGNGRFEGYQKGLKEGFEMGYEKALSDSGRDI